MSTEDIVWIIVGGVILIAIVAAIVGRILVRRGLREPAVIRRINHRSEAVIDFIKQPLTIAVLGEVADVLKAGHYASNIATALQENRDQLKAMIAEKIKADRTTRHIGLIPFHDKIIDETSDIMLRVTLEVLADPRTDELISDLLQDNIAQLRKAIREREEHPRAAARQDAATEARARERAAAAAGPAGQPVATAQPTVDKPTERPATTAADKP